MDVGKLGVEQVQVRAAHAAGEYLEKHLVRIGLGQRNVVERQRSSRRSQSHCFHRSRGALPVISIAR